MPQGASVLSCPVLGEQCEQWCRMPWRRDGGTWSPEMAQVSQTHGDKSGQCLTAGAAPWWPITASTSASKQSSSSVLYRFCMLSLLHGVSFSRKCERGMAMPWIQNLLCCLLYIGNQAVVCLEVSFICSHRSLMVSSRVLVQHSLAAFVQHGLSQQCNATHSCQQCICQGSDSFFLCIVQKGS